MHVKEKHLDLLPYLKCTMRNYFVKKFSERLDNLNISDYNGLSSPGLTCYLNSVLQVLFMTEDFREAVKGCNSKHSTTLDPYLGELFNHLERQVAKTNNITQKLGIRDVFKQRDAAEYFEKILCLTSPEASKVFKGEINNETVCHGCSSKSHSKNFFWVLPLAVEDSNHKAFNVQRGLESFFEEQIVHGENQMYCNSCNKKQNAYTGCKIMHSPDVLTLMLKRFTFDYKKNCYVKLKCKADVAQTIHIQKCRYDLYAVVHHFGDLSGGHYTADIKSFETGQWYCFNDHIVKRVKPQHFEVGDNFLRSHTAYLLMYRKVSGQSKKTDVSDLETHRAHSGLMDKERTDQAAVGNCREGNDKHLNGDDEASWRRQTSSLREFDKQFVQRASPVRRGGNILPPAVIETNGQQYGTKERMQPVVVNNPWKREAGVGIQGKNTKLRKESHVSGVSNSHIKPHQVHSPTPSLPRRSRSACRTESNAFNGSPHSRRKSSSLQRNYVQTQEVTTDSSCKQKTLHTVTKKGKTDSLKGKENGKKRENKEPWKW